MAIKTLLEFIDSEQGATAIRRGVESALNSIEPDLPDGLLGGTELAYDVGVKQISTGLVCENIVRGHLTCDTPDPENGEYDYYKIAGQKQTVSFRTNLTMRDSKRRRKLRIGDVEWIGNAVTYLDGGSDHILIVSCSGLSDLDDEGAAELIAASAKRELLRAYRRYALAA